jgi:DNA-directed RNA polymerase
MKVKDRADIPVSKLARLCLDYGIDRDVVKRNVMTFAYSSKKFGMSQQHSEDLMRPLDTNVLAGELAVHPFAVDDDAGRAAAKYLASLTYAAITELVALPAEAMGFLQTLARAMAHEGKPLCWTTPTGLPWVNAYYEPHYIRVRLWLHNSSVTMKLADGDTQEIDKAKAANGVAPNFVHACDAAHLMLTVNAAVADGIRNIATVHDSFGCLAPQAARFNEIIREQFVVMYSRNDVLAQVATQAKCDLNEHNWQRLPDAVTPGAFNINEVTNAQFAFA